MTALPVTTVHVYNTDKPGPDECTRVTLYRRLENIEIQAKQKEYDKVDKRDLRRGESCCQCVIIPLLRFVCTYSHRRLTLFPMYRFIRHSQDGALNRVLLPASLLHLPGRRILPSQEPMSFRRPCFDAGCAKYCKSRSHLEPSINPSPNSFLTRFVLRIVSQLYFWTSSPSCDWDMPWQLYATGVSSVFDEDE